MSASNAYFSKDDLKGDIRRCYPDNCRTFYIKLIHNRISSLHCQKTISKNTNLAVNRFWLQSCLRFYLTSRRPLRSDYCMKPDTVSSTVYVTRFVLICQCCCWWPCSSADVDWGSTSPTRSSWSRWTAWVATTTAPRSATTPPLTRAHSGWRTGRSVSELARLTELTYN